MSFNNKTSVGEYSVPLVILMDVLRVVINNDLPNKIAGINVHENIVWLRVKFPAEHPYATETRKNIEDMLADYGYYMRGYSETDLNGENNF